MEKTTEQKINDAITAIENAMATYDPMPTELVRAVNFLRDDLRRGVSGDSL